MSSITRNLKMALVILTYPIGIFIENTPSTLHYGLMQLNPKKTVWRMKYHQSYPSCVWFDRYPKELKVVHIGVSSYSANAIQAPTSTEIHIGDRVRIGLGLKIIDKKTAYNQKLQEMPKLHIGNGVFIGTDVKIMVAGGGKLTICDGAIIGAGSIITKSINKKGTYAGVPAQLIV